VIPVETLNSGFGQWTPLLWLAVFLLLWLVTWLWWSSGNASNKKGTEQGRPFLSGHAQPDTTRLHVRGENLYWGFLEALKGYYRILVPLHSGHVADYLLWFFGVLIAVLIVGWLS